MHPSLADRTKGPWWPRQHRPCTDNPPEGGQALAFSGGLPHACGCSPPPRAFLPCACACSMRSGPLGLRPCAAQPYWCLHCTLQDSHRHRATRDLATHGGPWEGGLGCMFCLAWVWYCGLYPGVVASRAWGGAGWGHRARFVSILWSVPPVSIPPDRVTLFFPFFFVICWIQMRRA